MNKITYDDFIGFYTERWKSMWPKAPWHCPICDVLYTPDITSCSGGDELWNLCLSFSAGESSGAWGSKIDIFPPHETIYMKETISFEEYCFIELRWALLF